MDFVLMKPHFLVFLIILLSSLAGWSQANPGLKSAVSSSTTEEFKKGIVVEEVENNSEAKKAGLQKNDIILRWARGGSEGQLESPFDLSSIEIEQAPLGVVTLEGLRGTARQTWTLGPNSWGLKARPDFPLSLLAAYHEGEALAKASKLVEAAERWRALADEVSKSSSSAASAWLFFHLATALYNGKLTKDADQAYQDARQSCPAIAAEMFRLRGEYFQSVLESRKSGHQTLTEAWGLNMLGNLAADLGDSPKALAYYGESLTIRENLVPDSLPVAGNLANLGLLYWRLGDLAKAEQHSRRGLMLGLKLAPVSVPVAANLNNLGLVSWQSGDLQSADTYYRKAMDVQKQVNPNSNLTPYLMNLGIVASDRDDFTQAERYFLQVLKLREQGDPGGVGVAAILENLADLFRRRHDLARAEDSLLRALAILKTPAHEGALEATVLGDLGRVLRERGDLIAAEAYQKRALSIARHVAPDGLLTADILNELAELRATGNDLDAAEDYYRQALGLRVEELTPKSATRVESLVGLASVMRHKGRGSEAAQFLEQALNALEYQTVHLVGTRRQRTDFRARHAGYYRDYVDVLIEQKKTELAFSVLERSRAQSLLEMLAQAHVDIRKGADPGLLARERSLRQSLTAKSNQQLQLLSNDHTEAQAEAAKKEVETLLEQYQQTQEQLRAASPNYSALTQPEPMILKHIQERLLDADTLLLEYALGPQRSYLWAVTSSSLTLYPLPKLAEIEGLARPLYGLLTERNSADAEVFDRKIERRRQAQLHKVAAALSRMVLGPVAEQIRGKRLLIVSDGILRYVPFAALPEPEVLNAGREATQRPLILGHEIVSLPSASVLGVLRQEASARQKPPKTIAVLADPVFSKSDARLGRRPVGQPARQGAPISQGRHEDGTGFAIDRLIRSVRDVTLNPAGELYLPRLPFSRREAKAIAAVTTADQRIAALDFEASREWAIHPMLAQYRIVHFATHGLLDSKHPELSGLVFSLVDRKGRPQNGFLDLQDVYNLNLPADLVVLSACGTALGKDVQGEGLVGLTRGFMYAGATRVMASLWSVDDAATAELMRRFYDALLRQDLPPTAALRQAQVRMSKQEQWKDPFYWAGFVIEGDWQSRLETTDAHGYPLANGKK